MKKQQFILKVIDKDKKEHIIFDFRLLEERAKRLQDEETRLFERFQNWQMDCNMLWAEINKLKKKLV